MKSLTLLFTVLLFVVQINAQQVLSKEEMDNINKLKPTGPILTDLRKKMRNLRLLHLAKIVLFLWEIQLLSAGLNGIRASLKINPMLIAELADKPHPKCLFDSGRMLLT